MASSLSSLDTDLVRAKDLVEHLSGTLGITFEEAHEALAPIADALLALPGAEHQEALLAISDGDF